MSKRGYNHVQELLPAIKTMRETGMTYREIAEHYGLKDKEIVRQLLIRENRKERKIVAGELVRPKCRPFKGSEETEIERLRMENKLLRDFLQSTERK